MCIAVDSEVVEAVSQVENDMVGVPEDETGRGYLLGGCSVSKLKSRKREVGHPA